MLSFDSKSTTEAIGQEPDASPWQGKKTRRLRMPLDAHRLRSNLGRTIGSLAIVPIAGKAYLGFGVFGAILCYCLADYTITSTDWLYGTIELIAMLVCVVVLPEQFVKNRDTRFIFPSAGYYERFLGK